MIRVRKQWVMELFQEWNRVTRFDSWALACANSNPHAHEFFRGDCYGNPFYRFKDRFLMIFGIPDGYDLQRLKLECNGCDGTGRWGRWRSDGGEFCRRCNGSGVFEWRHVKLVRYDVQGLTFHRPEWISGDTFAELSAGAQTMFTAPIEHWKATATDARLACCWLMLRFDRKALRGYLRAWIATAWFNWMHYSDGRLRPVQRIAWAVSSVLARARRMWRREAELPF